MENTAQIAKATVRSTFWNYASFAISKGLTFVSTIILARLLAPNDFGLLSMGLIAINYLDALNEFGIGPALIYQQGDLDQKSRVAFTLSMSVNSLLTLVAFFGAPLMALFFKETRVTSIIQVLSLYFILSSLGSTHATRLKKELNFQRNFIPEMGRAIAKGGLSILMAALGYGVWSLVIGQLAGVLVSDALYWVLVPWRPSFSFDWKTARSLLGYGSQIILVDLLGMIHQNVDYLFIGRRLDPTQLGYYTMAFRLPELIILSLCNIVSRALFPAYAKLQNNIEALQKGYLITIRYLSLLTLPIGVGLCLLSREFVLIFYSEKWAEVIPVMQVLSLYAIVYSLAFNAGDIYKAMGKPWILNVIGIIKLVIIIPVLWYTAGISIFAVGIAQFSINIILTLIELAFVIRIIHVTPFQILGAIFPGATAALAMFVGVYFLKLQMTSLPDIARLILLSIAGAGIYVAVLWFSQRKLFVSAFDIIRASARRAS